MSSDLLMREERLTYSLSQFELERRWGEVRKRMASGGIDYLLTQTQQRFSSGYLRWFTDISPSGYHTTLLFPQVGEMTVVAHGARSPAQPSSPPKWMQRGIGTVINVPSTPSIEWEDDWHAKKIAEAIRGSKPQSGVTVGFVGLGNTSAALTEYIRKELPDAKFVNASALVDDVKDVKSDEEQKLLKISAQLHARSYDLAKKAIRPGRSAIEVIQELRTDQLMQGGEDGQIFIWFGPIDGPRYEQLSHGNGFIRRRFKENDVVDILIECTGPGGYWYDLRRILYIGSNPPAELREAQRISKEALALLVSTCKPGAPAAAGMETTNAFFRGKGMSEELRILGHGQGADMVETPMIDTEERRRIETGMCLALHPTAMVKSAVVSISDDFLVTASGSIPLDDSLARDDEIATIG